MGECDNNPGYMLENCQKACGVCESTVTSGIQSKTKTVVDDLVQDSAKFGVVQNVAEGNEKQATLDTIQKMMNYLDSNEYESLPSKIKANCKNNVCHLKQLELFRDQTKALSHISACNIVI